MGRGLSDLQKTILQIAYENSAAECIRAPRHVVLVETGNDCRRPVGNTTPLEEIRERLLSLTDVPLLWHGVGEWAGAVREASDLLAEKHRMRWELDRTESDAWMQERGLDFQFEYTAPNTHSYAIDATEEKLIYHHPFNYFDYYSIYAGIFEERSGAESLKADLAARGFEVWLSWEWPVCISVRQWQEEVALYNYEVLWRAFDFGKHSTFPYRDRIGRRIGTVHHFNPDKIGRAKYNAAKVAVSRAIKIGRAHV